MHDNSQQMGPYKDQHSPLLPPGPAPHRCPHVSRDECPWTVQDHGKAQLGRMYWLVADDCPQCDWSKVRVILFTPRGPSLSHP